MGEWRLPVRRSRVRVVAGGATELLPQGDGPSRLPNPARRTAEFQTIHTLAGSSTTGEFSTVVSVASAPVQVGATDLGEIQVVTAAGVDLHTPATYVRTVGGQVAHAWSHTGSIVDPATNAELLVARGATCVLTIASQGWQALVECSRRTAVVVTPPSTRLRLGGVGVASEPGHPLTLPYGGTWLLEGDA